MMSVFQCLLGALILVNIQGDAASLDTTTSPDIYTHTMPGWTTETAVTDGNQTTNYSPLTTKESQEEGPVKSAPTFKFESGMVIVPVFLILGLFGNIMTIIVINRKKFGQMTSSIILTALSVSDTMLIVMVPFNKKFFLNLLYQDPRSISLFSCKLFFWFWRTSKMTSSWLVVLICVERFIAVWLPLNVASLFTKKRVLIGVLAIYIGIGGFNLSWSIIADVLSPTGTCLPNMASHPSYLLASKAFIIAGTLVYSIIPAIIVFLLNLLIITRLVVQNRRRKALMDVTSAQDATLTKTTVMLVTVSTAFIILVVPISIAQCLAMFANISIFTATEYSIVVLREVAQTLEQLNYSINFFLYVLSSSRFRHQVWMLLCSVLQKNKMADKSSSSESQITGATDVKDFSNVDSEVKAE